jgi:hypothetical protein
MNMRIFIVRPNALDSHSGYSRRYLPPELAFAHALLRSDHTPKRHKNTSFATSGV